MYGTDDWATISLTGLVDRRIEDSEERVVLLILCELSSLVSLYGSTVSAEVGMVLLPVSVDADISGSSTSTYASVRQQQTISATKIRSAKNGMKFEIVFCGFSIPDVEK